MEIDGVRVWRSKSHEVLNSVRKLLGPSHYLYDRLQSFLLVSNMSNRQLLCSEERNVVTVISLRSAKMKPLNVGRESLQ